MQQKYDLARLSGVGVIFLILILIVAQFLGIGEINNSRIKLLLDFAAILLVGHEAGRIVKRMRQPKTEPRSESRDDSESSENTSPRTGEELSVSDESTTTTPADDSETTPPPQRRTDSTESSDDTSSS